MVLNATEITAEHLELIGGKAANLYLLSAKGFHVPEWIVIPHNEACINDELHISNFLKKLPEAEYYAVRSSAEGEDGETQSWAGLFESFLFVKKEQLKERIKLVVDSVQSERVQSYLKDKTLPKMAVIVQVMVNADVSGVAFGINPVTGNRKEIVINSLHGLGEGLVSGELTSDQYILNGNQIKKNIADKKRKVIIQPEGGIQYLDQADELRTAESLSSDQLREISMQLKKLYHITGKYQDVEFAYQNNKLYILQTRPITTQNQIPDTGCSYSVWDNSNIIESYPGLTGPLTFSFIVNMYERVYIQLLELFGVKEGSIQKNKYVFKNMLGLMHGRVYYNLYSWYKVLSLLPGYSLNASFMERMMGVKEKFVLEDFQPKSKMKDVANVIRMIFSMIRNIRRLPKNTRGFEKHFESIMQSFWKLNLDELDSLELLTLYRRLEDELLSKWKPPLVNDFFAMIYFGLIPKMIENYAGKSFVHLQNDLLCGAKDIVSVEPASLITGIVAHIKNHKSDLLFFQNHSAKEIWQILQSKPNEKIYKLISLYLGKFGDRCVGELKLETKTYKQVPENFIEIVKTHLKNSKASKQTNPTQVRTEAEKKIKRALRGKLFKRLLFNHVLGKTRTLVSNRENLRFRRTQAYGFIREIFIALGKRFYAENLIDDPDDIFSLTINELFDFIEGKAVSINLKKLVKLRKEEYNVYGKHENIEERFKTYGIPYLGNSFKNDIPLDEDSTNIEGIGCCAGIVKQRVRVVTDPVKAGVLNGEILVTESTDPGWVTLFSSISGIIVERGSLLSHSAIVSREMGIPCIVGVKDVLKKLNNGDWIEMDGATGQIIVEPKEGE